ncbi:hypothetical protein EH165_14595 [Nakamurella antarctica]|uniref:ABC3 transporter permease C-terminal domain-containing protein n=1 Tax=Nakamurella antarctica TaxID=1902245 RepID=A0A3G8ZYT5_9ACTN|nr:FtsX-like permease family protein [Nakamurella antarctica]AZI59186.1 hypothetical protein EH165_14595 [Nakamurella antarctica]
MTTEAPAQPLTYAPTAQRGSLRHLVSDLAIGVRLAVRGGRGGWLRLVLTAGGIGLCVAVLLLGASFSSALDTRDARADSLNPVGFELLGARADAPTFVALPYTQTYRGLLVTGADVAPIESGAAAPPGLTHFPAPGTLAVSPALLKLLVTTDGYLLRPRFTEPVAAVIDESGLTSPTDLRFYRGIAPSSVADQDGGYHGLSSGWGKQDWRYGYNGDVYGDLTRAALVTGAAVVLVPLLIFVSLMSRLGSGTRDRRSAVLGLMGATGAQRRRVLAGETLVGAVAGVLLGAAWFFVIRTAPWIRVAGDGFFTTDISPQPWLAALIVVGVPVIATAGVVSNVRPSRHDKKSGKSARPGWRVVFALIVFALIAIQLTGILVSFSPVGLAILGGTVVLGLLLVPVLLPLLLAVVANRLPSAGLAWHLAIRRLQSNIGAASRSVAGISVVVAAAIAFQALLAMTSTVVDTGRYADRDPNQFQIQVHGATQAEMASLTALFQRSGGVTAVTAGSYVWLGANPDSSSFEAFVATCPQIEATSGITDCRDGDVFRVGAYGSDPITPGATLSASAAVDRSSSSWSLPDVIRDAQPDDAMNPFAPYLIVTEGAIGPNLDGVLANSFAYFTLRATGADAVDQLRNVVGGFGSRAEVTGNSEWAADSPTIKLTSTLQTGLILGGGLTLLVALLGLLVVAVEQLVERRRTLTLAVAAGAPRGLIARSILAGAMIPAVTGAILGIAVGALLTFYASAATNSLSGSSITPAFAPNWLIALLIGVTAVLASLLVTAATLPAVPALTRLEKMRTE